MFATSHTRMRTRPVVEDGDRRLIRRRPGRQTERHAAIREQLAVTR
jgi:hypothetical protein